jgi:hypothetical protein
LAPGTRSLLVFAVLPRRAGIDVVNLGADVPPQSWVEAVERPTAAVVLVVPTVEDIPAAREVVGALVPAVSDLPIHVGGGHQDGVGGGSLPLGHELGAAARALAGSLAGAARSGSAQEGLVGIRTPVGEFLIEASTTVSSTRNRAAP